MEVCAQKPSWLQTVPKVNSIATWNSPGGDSTSQEIFGSSLTKIENSETVALVVGLVVMFILVIYARSVMLPFTSLSPTKTFILLTSFSLILAIF